MDNEMSPIYIAEVNSTDSCFPESPSWPRNQQLHFHQVLANSKPTRELKHESFSEFPRNASEAALRFPFGRLHWCLCLPSRSMSSRASLNALYTCAWTRRIYSSKQARKLLEKFVQRSRVNLYADVAWVCCTQTNCCGRPVSLSCEITIISVYHRKDRFLFNIVFFGHCKFLNFNLLNTNQRFIYCDLI